MKAYSIFFAIIFFCNNALTQTIGNVGINTTTPKAMLHVKDSSVLFSGGVTIPFTLTNPPASGPGVRMMWYPGKGAFRVGVTDNSNWDRDSIGIFSFASGSSGKAIGYASTAMGSYTIASGDYSTAIGFATTAVGFASTTIGSNTKALGIVSTAIGEQTIASGDFSTSMGTQTTASGKYSTSIGLGSNAKGYASTVLGMYNDSILTTNQTAVTPTTPLLIVGNGDGPLNRNNAMVVLKNGSIGINTSAPQAMLHVKDSSVLFRGATAISSPSVFYPPPVSGAGVRMMWYPNRAAFRAGAVDGTQWNLSSVGVHSFAAGSNTIAAGTSSLSIGDNTKALGEYSIALGKNAQTLDNFSVAIGTDTKADGQYCFAMGYSTIAALAFSTAMGNTTKASGANSTAMGLLTRAAGEQSTSMGLSTNAKGFAGTALGMFNDSILTTNQTAVTTTTPLFIVGNGNSDIDRSNALVVLKNGNIGINTSAPQTELHVIRNAPSSGPKSANAIATLESNQSGYLQFSTTNANESGILAGNFSTSIRSAVIFRIDSSIHFRVGGNSTRMAIDKSGNVGVGTIVPTSKLHITGSVSKPIQSTVANITLDVNDYTTIILPTTSTVVISLPAANTCVGREYIIVNKDGSNFTTSINYQDLTNSSTNALPALTSITLQSDGTNWQRIR
jgi:hypothetical protein